MNKLKKCNCVKNIFLYSCHLLMVGEQNFALTFSYLKKKKLAYYSNNNIASSHLKTCSQKHEIKIYSCCDQFNNHEQH